MSVKSKQTLYFHADVAAEIKAEAERQERSMSWVVQKAWRIARKSMAEIPDADEPEQGAKR